MTHTQSFFNPEFGKRVVRLAMTVVGLLVLRAILGNLPMLANATALGSSLMSPLVIADAIVDTLFLIVLLQFGLRVGRSLTESSTRFPDVGKIITLVTLVVVLLIAYRQYELPTACLLISPSDLSKLSQGGQLASDVSQILPFLNQMMQGILNAEVNLAMGATLTAIQNAAVLVLRRPPDIYGWTFLILAAIPMVGIVVLISRNLDGFTDMIFHAASSTSRLTVVRSTSSAQTARQCGNCGEQMAAEVKFCSNCGTTACAPIPIVSSQRTCSSCGADNSANARYCTACGNAA